MSAQMEVTNQIIATFLHRTTQQINGGNINSMGSNANFGTEKAELI